MKEETILFYKKEFDEARSLILSTYGLRLFCEFAIRAANHFNKHPHSSPFSVTQLTFARAQPKGSGDKSLARRRFKNIRARQIVCRSDARHVGFAIVNSDTRSHRLFYARICPRCSFQSMVSEIFFLNFLL